MINEKPEDLGRRRFLGLLAKVPTIAIPSWVLNTGEALAGNVTSKRLSVYTDHRSGRSYDKVSSNFFIERESNGELKLYIATEGEDYADVHLVAQHQFIDEVKNILMSGNYVFEKQSVLDRNGKDCFGIGLGGGGRKKRMFYRINIRPAVNGEKRHTTVDLNGSVHTNEQTMYRLNGLDKSGREVDPAGKIPPWRRSMENTYEDVDMYTDVVHYRDWHAQESLIIGKGKK